MATANKSEPRQSESQQCQGAWFWDGSEWKEDYAFGCYIKSSAQAIAASEFTRANAGESVLN